MDTTCTFTAFSPTFKWECGSVSGPWRGMFPVRPKDSRLLSLESETGILVIGQLSLGPAGEMELPRAGLYEGIASWTGREAVAAYHDDILRQIDDDWGVEEISRAWRGCPFTEEYVLDLSFSRPSTPDED